MAQQWFKCHVVLFTHYYIRIYATLSLKYILTMFCTKMYGQISQIKTCNGQAQAVLTQDK